MYWLRQSFVLHAERWPPLFWMDTLCIPVGDAEKALRTTAINQMASIYTASVKELVLDAELLKCSASVSTATQTLARMACSAWMTRSWTLQEGVFARKCVFQFDDRTVDPIHEWCLHGERDPYRRTPHKVNFPDSGDAAGWAIYEELFNNSWDILHQDWKSSFRLDPPDPAAYEASGGGFASVGRFHGSQAVGKVHTLPAAQGLSKRGRSSLDGKDHFTMHLGSDHCVKQLVDSWNELAHRSTTKSEDLHVIIANLLDFNAGKVMDIPTRADRMRAMISSFDVLPISLFWNTGPKWIDELDSRDTCNRWMSVEPSISVLTLSPVMRVTPHWLQMKFETSQNGNAVMVQVLLLQRLSVLADATFLFNIPQTAAVYRVTLQVEQARIMCDQFSSSHSFCLIIETHLQPDIEYRARGALFKRLPLLNETKASQVQLTYCCPVILCRSPVTPETSVPVTIAEVLPGGVAISVKYGKAQNSRYFIASKEPSA